jgi:L-fuculose-phosphate aldolase
MIATGPDLDKAMWLAVEVETLCKQYAAALKIGTPHVLSDDEIAQTVERFRHYGARSDQPPDI